MTILIMKNIKNIFKYILNLQYFIFLLHLYWIFDFEKLNFQTFVSLLHKNICIIYNLIKFK